MNETRLGLDALRRGEAIVARDHLLRAVEASVQQIATSADFCAALMHLFHNPAGNLLHILSAHHMGAHPPDSRQPKAL